MKPIKASVQNIALIGLVVVLGFGSFFAAAPIAHAQFDDFSSGGGFYDDFSSGGGFYDDFSSGGGFYDDYSSGGGYYDDYSAGGGYFDDYSSGGGYFDDFSSGGGYYDDFSSGGGFYDDFSSGGGFYDDFSSGGGFYDDFSSGGGYYDDFSVGGGYYDDFSVGGSYYDDVARSGTWYDDVPRSGSYYDDVARSGSYYDDVARAAAAQQPTYTPASYAVDSYTPASYAVDSYTPASYAMTTGGYGSSLGYGSMPFMGAAVGASMPYYGGQQQPYYQNQQRSQNYPTPSYSAPSSFSTNTSNYCTGNSCNSSYIDNSYVNNSINSSFNTTHPSTISTVYPVTALPIVQYQYPYNYNYNYSYPTYNSNLYCTITANPTFIQNGQATYLSWSSNGSSAWLSDGIGYVSANGSLAVRPDASRTYTLTIYGQGGSNVCTVTVSVGGSAPYVSLSQIPYTGFDLGPIGNAMYMLSLVAIAIGSAYFALYYKGGVLAIAGSMIKRPLARTTPVVAHAVHAAPTPVAHAAHASREIKDTMFITRSKDGVPRIVINRA